MKALTYHGTKDVRVETVDDPTIVAPDDIILRITATAICGSDLHIYHGKIPKMESGDILGHEFMGVVEAAGSDVTAVSVGDRVVIPFVIACGGCFFCERELFAACETTNPDRGAILNKKQARPAAALFGYSHLYGGVPGGQAEFVRVPYANVGPLRIPDGLSDEQVLFLSDILPTGYQAVQNAEVGPGSTLAIFGAGPVGLMAAACARMLGVEEIYMVDHHPYRLNFAVENYNVIPINFDEQDDPAAQIIDATDGRGVDASIEAVGFEAKGSTVEAVATAIKLEASSGRRAAPVHRGDAARRRGQRSRRIRRLDRRVPVRRRVRQRPHLQDGPDARTESDAGTARSDRRRQAQTRDHHFASPAARRSRARIPGFQRPAGRLPQSHFDAVREGETDGQAANSNRSRNKSW